MHLRLYIVNRIATGAVALTIIMLTGCATSLPKSRSDANEPNLPPPDMKLKEPWATIEKKGFNDWKIKHFVDWSGLPDGGSIVFQFLTERGDELDVLVANPNYWTDADKIAKRQVIYLIDESGRYYLLAPASKQEEHLLRILTDAVSTLKGKDKLDPKYVKALIDQIKDRKPRDYNWPMTKEEVDEANKRDAEQVM